LISTAATSRPGQAPYRSNPGHRSGCARCRLPAVKRPSRSNSRCPRRAPPACC
jgi:hypothetical protein